MKTFFGIICFIWIGIAAFEACQLIFTDQGSATGVLASIAFYEIYRMKYFLEKEGIST